MEKHMYIASCDEEGGLYHYVLNERGASELKEIKKLDRPMFMCIEVDKMHVLLRAPFKNENSGALSFDIAKNGELVNPTEVYDTEGKVACHISSADGKIFCANYTSGSVCMLNKKLVVHSGKTGSDLSRQTMPHAHQMALTPDKKFVCAIDLGLDAVIVYDLDLNEICRANVPDAYGARHCVFSKDGKKLYVVNELSAHVSVFSFNPENGECEYISSFASREGAPRNEIAAAAIRLSGDERFLYISDRGDNTISKFETDGFELKNMKKFDCGGISPRDFDITPDGKLMVVTNEKTDNVCIFGIDLKSGDITKVSSLENIKNPLCVVFN